MASTALTTARRTRIVGRVHGGGAIWRHGGMVASMADLSWVMRIFALKMDKRGGEGLVDQMCAHVSS
jgi:hypothetical protein